MMIKNIIIIGLSIITLGCSNESTIYMKTDASNGLELGGELKVDNLVVGQIANINVLESGEVLLKTILNPDTKIPKNSIFRNVKDSNSEEDIKYININLGSSNDYLINNDTVFIEKNLKGKIDSIANSIKDNLIDKIKDKFNRNKD